MDETLTMFPNPGKNMIPSFDKSHVNMNETLTMFPNLGRKHNNFV